MEALEATTRPPTRANTENTTRNRQLDDVLAPFMQDNAPIHMAQRIEDWFENHAIPRLSWPPYSPDLNPIENV